MCFAWLIAAATGCGGAPPSASRPAPVLPVAALAEPMPTPPPAVPTTAPCSEVPPGTPLPFAMLPGKALRTVRDSHQPEMKRCYDRTLSRAPLVAGQVRIKLEVGADGRVGKVELHGSTAKDEGLERCVLDSARLWVFPHPVGPPPARVLLLYTFVPRFGWPFEKLPRAGTLSLDDPASYESDDDFEP